MIFVHFQELFSWYSPLMAPESACAVSVMHSLGLRSQHHFVFTLIGFSEYVELHWTAHVPLPSHMFHSTFFLLSTGVGKAVRRQPILIAEWGLEFQPSSKPHQERSWVRGGVPVAMAWWWFSEKDYTSEVLSAAKRVVLLQQEGATKIVNSPSSQRWETWKDEMKSAHTGTGHTSHCLLEEVHLLSYCRILA